MPLFVLLVLILEGLTGAAAFVLPNTNNDDIVNQTPSDLTVIFQSDSSDDDDEEDDGDDYNDLLEESEEEDEEDDEDEDDEDLWLYLRRTVVKSTDEYDDDEEDDEEF